MSSDLTLTDEQTIVFDSIWKFITKDDEHLGLLQGPAGSGKTFLNIQIIKKVLGESFFSNVALCAPTWKAVKVLKEMMPSDIRHKMAFTSLHSLLGLKHKITNNGKEVFERDKQKPSKLCLYDVVIVDEASMIADELFKELEEQNYRGIKILFVGDANQINPINHEHSIPMLPAKREEHKIKLFELTKIVRQAEGNPIIATSQRILKDEFKFVIGEKEVVDNKGYAILNKNQPEIINTLLKHYFCSPEFDKNPNHCKVIAWRNATVDNFNKLIRGMKYGMHADKIVVGEKLIVEKPIKGDVKEEILFNTNDDLSILRLEVKTKELHGIKYNYYDAMVQGDEEVADIHILHETSNQAYTINLKRLADDAKNEKDHYRRGQKWIKYFEFIENFAQVKYNYAITVHNSQGSTFTNCFAVYTDIVANYNNEERKRILYTAVTRPRELLYIM